MPSTIKDVAKLAGCSITTVSRAFSSPELVKPETLKKIEYAAKYCNYSPNTIARAMVKQRNNTIAFVVHEKHYPIFLNPFYAAISESAGTEAERLGYNVFVVSSETFSKDASNLFLNKRVDGAIIAGQHEKELITTLTQNNCPLVLVNNSSENQDIVSITTDDYNGTVQAVEHLIHTGHTKIGIVSGNLYSYISSIRHSAFMDTLARHNISIMPQHMGTCEPVKEDAMKTVMNILSSSQPPTALFCMNDLIAVGAAKAAIRMGFKIPDDISIVGYDNSSICTIFEPEISSVSIDTAKMGALSVQLLDAIICNKPILNKKVCLETELIARQSTVK